MLFIFTRSRYSLSTSSACACCLKLHTSQTGYTYEAFIDSVHQMLSLAAAVGFLQANFKRTFEDAEKEVEVAINQLIRASGGSIGTTEKCDARKKVSNALSEIKKQVTKFNSSALFFIGLNIDPMNPQFDSRVTLIDFIHKLSLLRM